MTMMASASFLDLTPDRHLPLPCKDPADGPSRAIGSRLEANVLLLESGGRKLVLVSIDWFFCSPTLRRRILERCSGLLSDAELLVAASHTHSSPNPDSAKSRMGAVDAAYVAGAEEAVAARVRELLDARGSRPVLLRYATAPTDCAVNRRRMVWWPTRRGLKRVMDIHPNAAGPCDRELRVVRVEGVDGGLLAVVWGVSCHPTDWPDPRQTSADFPGEVRSGIRARLGRSLPVLFLQGFAGNLRPACLGLWPRRGALFKRVARAGLTLLNGPMFAGFSPDGYRRWVDDIALSARRALDAAATAPGLGSRLESRRVSLPLSALGLAGEMEDVSMQAVRIGDDLVLAAISAEATWEYAERLRTSFPTKRIWPVGYADHVFGYLPTGAMLGEGGYECRGFMEPFRISGTIVPDIDDVIHGPFAGLIRGLDDTSGADR